MSLAHAHGDGPGHMFFPSPSPSLSAPSSPSSRRLVLVSSPRHRVPHAHAGARVQCNGSEGGHLYARKEHEHPSSLMRAQSPSSCITAYGCRETHAHMHTRIWIGLGWASSRVRCLHSRRCTHMCTPNRGTARRGCGPSTCRDLSLSSQCPFCLTSHPLFLSL
jgi:hypothetical protein